MGLSLIPGVTTNMIVGSTKASTYFVTEPLDSPNYSGPSLALDMGPGQEPSLSTGHRPLLQTLLPPNPSTETPFLCITQVPKGGLTEVLQHLPFKIKIYGDEDQALLHSKI
ncbi:hypothetical protein HYC85_018446 [Camellia sinensis]|uniref:Uncharacterized protein n=1 Tax=Camellia sinensis TaxID=4442 RepID=A0A7J7GUC1_CAMSI|nr:hypothetical protein HYC85_018446 [Camellia sinensis]